MYRLLIQKILQFVNTPAPAIGIGLFRCLYGLVALQEILFLFYFRHLIFDPVPYLDVEFPMIPFFLGLWALAAFCLSIGYHCQRSAIICYVFWIVFVQFTPMQRDFDGGFDLFMTGAGAFLLFMPMDKALSIDKLRHKWHNPFKPYTAYPPESVTVLAYYLPVAVCLGFLYFDSAIHKLFAPHWRNGLGSWLPATQPYYVSALDMSPLLNLEWLQKTVGYTILVFQFSFIFLVQNRYLRPLYLIIGLGLHLGITLTLNIYPFGLGMAIFYVLIIPFSWWRALANYCTAKQPVLTVFYDERCPLCNRTVLTLNHFDILRRIEFKGVQTYAKHYPALNDYDEKTLLTDLYALDKHHNISFGVIAYSQILIHMGYLAWLGIIMRLPLVHPWIQRCYRHIADNRMRVPCDSHCAVVAPTETPSFYTHLLNQFNTRPQYTSYRFAKLLLIILGLQLNSSLHYGIAYRFDWDTHKNVLVSTLTEISNTLLLVTQTFSGITPHALYVHDHFAGYDRILAITYDDATGQEHWLPFVNAEGRLLAPNWGRVHSMWANIAVTPTINIARLRKLLMKVTAFWGTQVGLNLEHATFHIKLKKITAPNDWVYDLRRQNLSGTWQTIGTASWKNQQFTLTIPENIDAL